MINSKISDWKINDFQFVCHVKSIRADFYRIVFFYFLNDFLRKNSFVKLKNESS